MPAFRANSEVVPVRKVSSGCPWRTRPDLLWLHGARLRAAPEQSAPRIIFLTRLRLRKRLRYPEAAQDYQASCVQGEMTGARYLQVKAENSGPPSGSFSRAYPGLGPRERGEEKASFFPTLGQPRRTSTRYRRSQKNIPDWLTIQLEHRRPVSRHLGDFRGASARWKNVRATCFSRGRKGPSHSPSNRLRGKRVFPRHE